MGLYAYQGRDAAGKRAEGYVEAASPKEARRRLSESGTVAERLSEPDFRTTAGIEWRSRFFNGLGMLLKSGFPIDEALDFLAGEQEGEGRGAILAVKGRVVSGGSLLSAVSAVSGGLPPFEQAVLDVAEKTGMQGDILVRLSGFLDSAKSVREKIRGSLAYPCAILALAVLLLAVMAFGILPKAASLFPAGAAPASVRALGPLVSGILAALFLLAAASAAATAHVRRKARKDASAGAAAERFLLRVPVLRKILPQLWASRFAATMALLIESGIAPQDAVVPSGAATGSTLVAEGARTAADEIRGGGALGRAVLRIFPIAPVVSAWVAVGEKSGALADMLGKAAERAAAEYEARLRRFLSLLEPLLIGTVGIVVLAVALAVLEPMLELTTGGAV